MSKVVDFLNEAKTFYIATVEDDQPRVRPFGAAVEYNGKVYLSTRNDKKVYAQFTRNPKIEVSGIVKGKWIRITGNAVVDEKIEAKEAMLEANPFLKNTYSINDGIFAVFYIDKMKAVVSGFDGESVELDD